MLQVEDEDPIIQMKDPHDDAQGSSPDQDVESDSEDDRDVAASINQILSSKGEQKILLAYNQSKEVRWTCARALHLHTHLPSISFLSLGKTWELRFTGPSRANAHTHTHSRTRAHSHTRAATQPHTATPTHSHTRTATRVYLFVHAAAGGMH